MDLEPNPKIVHWSPTHQCLVALADPSVFNDAGEMIPILPEAMSNYWRERRAPKDLQFAFCLCSSSNPLMRQHPIPMNLVHPAGGSLQDKWAFGCPGPTHDRCGFWIIIDGVGPSPGRDPYWKAVYPLKNQHGNVRAKLNRPLPPTNMFNDTPLYPIQPERLHLSLAVQNSLSKTQFVGSLPGGSHFVGSLATTGSPSQSPSKSASSSLLKSASSPSKPHSRRTMSTRGSGHVSLPFTATSFSTQATSTPPPHQSFSPDPLSTIMEVNESLNSGNQTWDSIIDTSSGSSAEDSFAIDRYLNRYHAFPRVDDSVETSLGVLPPSVEASLDLLPPELQNGPVGDEFMVQMFGALENEPVPPPSTQPRIMKRSHSSPDLSFLQETTTVPGIRNTDADQSFFDKIIQLGDLKFVSGLSYSDFKDLFEQCHRCDNVMWKRVFYNHQCPPKKGKGKAKVEEDVIDLSDLSG
ncbi:hypothetical protein C8J56DRAFT_1048525 [Mycena floridula]|nr:hypothetical protein C8J56DRAFT_1048525 [Mycena floridula]